MRHFLCLGFFLYNYCLSSMLNELIHINCLNWCWWVGSVQEVLAAILMTFDNYGCPVLQGTRCAKGTLK